MSRLARTTIARPGRRATYQPLPPSRVEVFTLRIALYALAGVMATYVVIVLSHVGRG